MVQPTITPPPSSVYQDDSSIPDDAVLIRAIHPRWVEWEPALRLKSEAFQDYPPQRLPAGVPAVAMSVALLSEIEQRDHTMGIALARFSQDYGLATITAKQARDNEQGVTRWPTDEEPWHGMVFCLNGARRSNRHKRVLARCAVLVVPPQRGS